MINISPIGSSSRGNAYHITDNTTPILLDAGLQYKQIQKGLNFQTSQLKGCLISHEHGDHIKAVPNLIRAGIDVYMSEGTKEALDIDNHRIKVIGAKKLFDIGTWKILPFETKHDCQQPLGFYMRNKAGKNLLYATDTFYLKDKFKELNYIMIECNHSRKILNKKVKNGIISPQQKKRIIQTHFGLEQVIKFLKANDLSKVNEIWLLHLSDRNSNAKLFKKEIQELTGKMVKVAEE